VIILNLYKWNISKPFIIKKYKYIRKILLHIILQRYIIELANKGSDNVEGIKFIKTDNKIEIGKQCKAHVLSNKESLIIIAEYNYNNNLGSIYQFSNIPPKTYKSYRNWIKAVKRIFNIDVE
jgi:hypothetical protein